MKVESYHEMHAKARKILEPAKENSLISTCKKFIQHDEDY
jgi:hypothetical protein